MKLPKRLNAEQAGFTLPAVLSVILAASITGTAILTVIFNNFFVVGNTIKSQQAFNIAEAGVNYYLWHLSHNPTDYKDGQNTPAPQADPVLGFGPYVHNYVDDNAKVTGTYTLWIKPAGNGSTVVDIRSIGKVNGTNMTRTIQAQIGAASFASYSLAADTALWFGNTESANGPVHSNVGIRMDGSSSGDVTSANATYVPPGSLGGDGNTHPGVWCSSSVTSPVNCNTRPKNDWRYPVTAVDFNQVNTSLCAIKKAAFAGTPTHAALAAQNNACSATPGARTETYLPRRATSFNIARGYLVQLNTNNTYDLYNVNGENDRLTPYTSALTLQLVESGIPVDDSGVIFAEDNVWVRTNPTYHGRVTVAAGRLASDTQAANIVVADDILYSTKNGQDAIGLIAEDSVIVAPYAPPASGAFTFEIDAASLAQSGSVTYPSVYRTDTNRCSRGWVNSNQSFVYYGSVASRQTWTWTWQRGNSCVDAVQSGSNYYSGILNNSTQYDYNLLYAPPPSYPITGGYNILSWREVLTQP